MVPLLDQVFSQGEPYFGDEFPVVLERNGRPEDCFFNFIYQPIFDASNAVEGIAVVAFEVTDQVRARRRSEALAAALESTNRDLDQFAYVASHDLKAPLRGIASLSEWIEEALADKMNGETRRQMDLLRGRVHRLEALIDGILNYSRAGRVREKIEPVDLGALLGECRDLLAPPPEARIDIAPDMPTVMAERVPLQQIFLNLISNALKHGGRPDVHVTVGWADAGAAYDFTVRDDGGGIAAAVSRAHLGYLPDAAAPRPCRGDGDRPVRRQEAGREPRRAGQSRIRSGRGSDVPRPLAQAREGVSVSDKQLNILVIDDDEVDVMNVQRAFKKGNITNPVFVAGDGIHGLEMLRDPAFPKANRLVLLDLNMPRMNGIEFLRELRADPELKATTVVVLTTSNDTRDKVEAYNLNVAGYLTKPVTFTNFVDLMAALNKYWMLVELP